MNNRSFIILCLEGALLSFNVASAAALVPSIAKEFAVGEFITGRIVWLYMLAYGAAALFYGPLVRKFSARRIELLCFSLFSFANILAAFSPSIKLLFIARILMGIFGASVIPLVLIIISRYVEPTSRGKRIGVFFSATFFSSLAGLFLSGILPWRLIFLIPGVLGFLLLIFMFFYLPSFSEVKEEKASYSRYWAALNNRKIFSLFVYIFLISLFYHGVQQWLGVYFAKAFSFNQFVVSMLVTLTSFSGVFGEILGGISADKLGRGRTVKIGILLMIISVFALLYPWQKLGLALIMIIWGLGWTMNHAGLSTLLTELPKEFINEAASLNSSVRFISGGAGVIILSLIMQGGFLRGFICVGAGLILLLLASRRLICEAIL